MRATLKKAINRIQMLVGRATVESVNDSGEIQLLKVAGLDEEIPDGIERIQNYGFSSNVPAGGESVIIYVQGNREDGICVACDSGEYRIKGLKSGESIMFTKFGHKVHMKEDGTLLIVPGSTGAPPVEIGGAGLLVNAGVVTGQSLCAYTGVPHADFSACVRAKK